VRLVGYRHRGERWIGSVRDGRVRPRAPVDDFYAAGGDVPDRPGGELDLAAVEQVPPVPLTARVFCVGLNYHAHADEAKPITGLDAPAIPTVFGRWPSTLVVDGDPVPVPPTEGGLDWEVELAAIVGRRAWAVDAASALDHVLGYTAFNDLSARTKQLETTQWTLGKNADRSGPIGPVVVTRDEIGDPSGLRLRTRVNGELVQDSHTGLLIHGVGRLIEHISDTVTLRPGDVITTGTPGGVGLGRTPPRYLVPGDVVEVEIERIGTLRTPIVRRADLAPELLW
jgi:2-keto-4-pentenoate hydratase/2-oxohepta-3-ene-1,7-dioic acid hydratase in catechol pathway